MVRKRVQYQQALGTRTSRYTSLLALPALTHMVYYFINYFSVALRAFLMLSGG